MRKTETQEVGTIYLAKAGDDLSKVQLGREVTFRQVWRRLRGVLLGRAWYLQGDRGLLSVTDDAIDQSHDLCRKFLTDHGYKPTDDMEDRWVLPSSQDARPQTAAESERMRRQNNDLGPIS